MVYPSNKKPRYNTTYGMPSRIGVPNRIGTGIGTPTRTPFNFNVKFKYAPTTGGAGVTSQYDKKTIYRKKTMPRRKRRAWVKYAKKVNAVIMKDFGTKTVLRNTQVTRTWSDDSQDFFGGALFGKDGAVDSTGRFGLDDLRQIFNNDSELAQPTSSASFISGVLDLTFTNLSRVIGETDDNNAGVEIDVYELKFTKNIDGESMGVILSNAAANTDAINGSLNQINLNTRGATPFDLPDFCAQGVKILKKTKFFLSPGQTATYQYRDPKNYRIRKDRVDDGDNNFVLPYKTHGILFVSKGVPTATPSAVLKSLQVGATRKYAYKVLSKNSDADNVIP